MATLFKKGILILKSGEGIEEGEGYIGQFNFIITK